MNRGNASVVTLIILAVVIAGGGWWYLKIATPASVEETPYPATSQINTKKQEPVKQPSPTVKTVTLTANPVSAKPAENEISFTTPVGYVIEPEPSYQDATWHEVSGIDRRIRVTKQEYVQHPSASGEGPASIHINFYRNPQNLSALQWAQTKGLDYGYQSGAATTFNFVDRRGVRFPGRQGGLFLEDHVVVQHKSWIVLISNFSQRAADTQNQAFNQLLTSISFAQ